MTLANTVSIADVADAVVTVETCAQTDAHFAGDPKGISRARQLNTFLGWAASPATLRVFQIRDVILDRSLMVLLKEGRIIAETNYLQTPDSIAGLRARADCRSILDIDRPVAICFDHWDTNYFHWMAHAIPTVHAARQRHGDTGIGLVVPQLQPWQLASLKLLGASHLPRVETEPGAQYFLPEVEYYDYAAGRADFAISPLSRSAYVRMGDSIDPALPLHRRIYIDRGNATNRRVPNESALVARLAEHGFHIVKSEELSLEEQIALFKGASMVVGQHGAGMTNIAFCQPGTVVYELIPEHYQVRCFLAMALQGGLRYWADVFPTAAAGADHVSTWTRDIDIDHVIRRVRELETFISPDRRSSHPMSEEKPRLGSLARISRAWRARGMR